MARANQQVSVTDAPLTTTNALENAMYLELEQIIRRKVLEARDRLRQVEDADKLSVRTRFSA